jgi:transcriptional regulator with XRE-family HTH domain
MSQSRTRSRSYPNLKTWRAAQGLSQDEAAAKLDISQSYYAKLELGIRVPRKPIMKRILAETGVPLEVLSGVA